MGYSLKCCRKFIAEIQLKDSSYIFINFNLKMPFCTLCGDKTSCIQALKLH